MSTCETCRFFVRHKRTTLFNSKKSELLDTGECRRFPPVLAMVVIAGLHTGETTQPEVDMNDWCGEYRPRAPTDPEPKG